MEDTPQIPRRMKAIERTRLILICNHDVKKQKKVNCDERKGLMICDAVLDSLQIEQDLKDSLDHCCVVSIVLTRKIC